MELRDAHVKSIAGNLQLECAECAGKAKREDSPRLKSNGHMNHQTWQCLQLNSFFFLNNILQESPYGQTMVLGIFAVLDADSPSHMVTDPTGAAICLVHQPDPINKNPPINVSINIPAPLGSFMGMAVDGTYQPIGGATD